MIKEAYCSYETAKLLKEKGFDEPCRSYFIDYGDYIDSSYSTEELIDLYMGVDEILRPTHQMACAWLREKHNIDIEIRRSPNTMMYRCIVYKDTLVKCITDAIIETYEQAVEAALKYSLENLI